MSYHVDGIDSIFIERELEAVKAKTYDVKYANLLARTLIPVSHETAPGAETVKFNSYDMSGIAKVVKSYAKDFPRADVKVAEFRQAIKSLGSSYGFSIQELRAAAFAGVPLEQRKANSARRQIEFAIDKIAAIGDSVNGLTGLLNITNAQTYSIPNGAVSGTQAWSGKTGLEILADMNNATAKIPSTTLDVEHPTTMVLPIAQYALISSLPVNSGIAATVLSHYLATNPWVKEVLPWFYLAGAGGGGSDRMLIYDRNPDALWLEIPQEFEQFPAQPDGMEFTVMCHARIGGVLCPYPLSVLYADHI